jgi:hypothetical protein
MPALRSFGAAALALAVLLGGPAAAQTITSHATFAILPYDPPEGEQAARPGEPLLRQTVVATRAAKLDEEAPSLLGMGQVKTFPVGTQMFGVQVPDGWLYCAVSKKENRFWFTDVYACYQDLDGDGDFDQVRNSGPPFANIPLFVLQPGPPQNLPAPVRYSDLPYKDGPKVELGITWKGAGGRGAEATEIRARETMISGEVQANITDEIRVPVSGGRLRINGSDITVLGMNADGSLNYRIDRAMPAQIAPITLSQTTTTYWYVVSY